MCILMIYVQLYGFGYGGPFGHFFHKLMDAIFKGKKKDNTTVAKKVLPFFNAFSFHNNGVRFKHCIYYSFLRINRIIWAPNLPNRVILECFSSLVIDSTLQLLIWMHHCWIHGWNVIQDKLVYRSRARQLMLRWNGCGFSEFIFLWHGEVECD